MGTLNEPLFLQYDIDLAGHIAYRFWFCSTCVLTADNRHFQLVISNHTSHTQAWWVERKHPDRLPEPDSTDPVLVEDVWRGDPKKLLTDPVRYIIVQDRPAGPKFILNMDEEELVWEVL